MTDRSSHPVHAARHGRRPRRRALPLDLPVGRGDLRLSDRGRGRRGRPDPVDLGHLRPHARAGRSTATPATSPATTTTAGRRTSSSSATWACPRTGSRSPGRASSPTGGGRSNPAAWPSTVRSSSACERSASGRSSRSTTGSCRRSSRTRAAGPSRDTASRFAEFAARAVGRPRRPGGRLDHPQRAVVPGVPGLRERHPRPRAAGPAGRRRGGPPPQPRPRARGAGHPRRAGRAQLGIANIVTDVLPASERPRTSRRPSATTPNSNRLFLDPVLLGRYPAAVHELYAGLGVRGPRAPGRRGDDRGPHRLPRGQPLPARGRRRTTRPTRTWAPAARRPNRRPRRWAGR